MVQELLEFIKQLDKRDNVTVMSVADLAEQAKLYARPTVFGGLSFFSNVRSRSASQSVVLGSERVRDKDLNPGQREILAKLDTTLRLLRDYLQIAPLICVKRTIGSNNIFNAKCTLYLSTQRRDNVRQAYLWSKTLRDYDPSAPGPELYLVCIPEWPEHERQVLAFPEDGLTIVLGMDYVGEVKMGFLRKAMWWAKQEGMLSLHAGSKLLTARQRDGTLKRYGMLLFGLSGTGKTTHSCHDHGLHAEGESIQILQDDIVFLRKDGSALGTEQGFYLKTEGISPESQPIVYRALTSPEALLENVMVDYQGYPDFNNLTLGSNGRAVIPRTAFAPYNAEGWDLPPLDELDGLIIAFITRRMTVLPIVSKLSPEQAAAAFMLGESIETSAGDPRRAGESVRVVGTNPFLIGDEAEEGNWFYDFLKRNEEKVECYLLNTGGIGEITERDADGTPVVKQKTLRVAIEEMSAIIRGIARHTIEWEREPHFGTLVPKSVDGCDMRKFALERFYTQEQAQEYIERLKRERREWLTRFPGLDEAIVRAIA